MVSRIRSIALVGTASIAALALSVAPASAATTTIHSGSIDGPVFSGAVVATNLGDITVTTSLSNATCSSVEQDGTINSDGTNLTVTAASFSGCTSSLGAVTVTPVGLPWSGGSVVYDPVSGGADGTLTVAGFSTTSTVFGITCTYGGTLTGNGYNPDNANRPDTSVSQSEAQITNGTVSLTGSGNSFLCPSTATVSATYQLVGANGEQLWASS
jgi:hypothetical protein